MQLVIKSEKANMVKILVPLYMLIHWAHTHAIPLSKGSRIPPGPIYEKSKPLKMTVLPLERLPPRLTFNRSFPNIKIEHVTNNAWDCVNCIANPVGVEFKRRPPEGEDVHFERFYLTREIRIIRSEMYGG